MKKILIAYHSGSGSTKNISEILQEKFSNNYQVDLLEITRNLDCSVFDDYDMIVFGFPTFGCDPPKTVLELINNMPQFDTPKLGFVFTTYALYQENCLRHFIKKITKRNFIIADYIGIKGPASDGALVFPEKWQLIYTYDKRIKEKINFIIDRVNFIIDNKQHKTKLPWPKWYTPINRLLLRLFEKQYTDMREKINILSDRCVNCNICVDNCHRNCWQPGEKQPSFDHKNCELCLRCVHHCPKKAVVFSDTMKDRPRLNKAFYNKKKKELLSLLDS